MVRCELPPELRAILPQGLRESIELCVALPTGLSGDAGGQVYLLCQSGRLRVFTRVSFGDRPTELRLGPCAPARLERTASQTELVIEIEGGAARRVEVFSVDEEGVVALLGRCAPRQASAPEPEVSPPPRPDHSALEELRCRTQWSPLGPDAYHQLFQLYVEGGQLDAALCVADLTLALEQPTPAERAFHARWSPSRPLPARHRLTEETWTRCLTHPQVQPCIGAMFSAMARPVADLLACPHRAYGLNRKHRCDLATDRSPLSQIFSHAGVTLGVQADLYVKRTQTEWLTLAHTPEWPSYVAGRPLLEPRPESELAFAVGRELARLRPAFRLGSLIPDPAALCIPLLAAMELIRPPLPLTDGDRAEVNRFSSLVFSRTLPVQLVQLKELVQQLPRDATPFSPPDLERWLTGVEFAVDRAGLLLCGSLQAALRVMAANPQPANCSLEQRTEELVRFGGSHEYLECREAIGTSLSRLAVEDCSI